MIFNHLKQIPHIIQNSYSNFYLVKVFQLKMNILILTNNLLIHKKKQPKNLILQKKKQNRMNSSKQQLTIKLSLSKPVLAIISTVVSAGLITLLYKRFKKSKHINKQTVLDVIGSTPLIYLPKLSKAIGSEVYIKCEFMNPFGSSKDRAVKKMIEEAQKRNEFSRTKEVVEASSGSTAISLVQISHIKNIKPTIFLPNDLAEDKYTYLQILGANIQKVPPVSIVDANHFYNLANSYSSRTGAFFMNQFQNLDNHDIHYDETGPEIYSQTSGLMTAFVCGAGTGGSIAGVSKYFKEKNPNIDVVLADPQGSGLFNKIKYGVLFTNQEKQGYRLKNPFDTVIEGIGLNRPTTNFNAALIDKAYKIKDQQALHMAYYMIENEGIFMGGSSALNLAAVVKYAREHPGSKIVTVVHDLGNRYLKKFYSGEYLKEKGIKFQKRQKYDPELLDFVE